MCQNILWSFLKRFQDKVSKLTLKPFLILLSWVLERSRSLKCGIEGKLNFIKVLRGLFCSHSFLMRMLPSKVPGSNVVIWNYQINWSWWNVKFILFFSGVSNLGHSLQWTYTLLLGSRGQKRAKSWLDWQNCGQNVATSVSLIISFNVEFWI